MRTTTSRIKAGMSRAARARRLQVLVRGSAQPGSAMVVVPGAAGAAGAVVVPGVAGAAGAVVVTGAAGAAGAVVISGGLSAQAASAWAAVARACSSLTILSASAWEAEAGSRAGPTLP